MHPSRHTWILLAVATLVVGLAAPAAAKKGGQPGPPSGTGLEVTVEPTSVFMWANSDGDEIQYDITVTNSSGDTLEGVTVVFDAINGQDEEWGPFDLGKNESWPPDPSLPYVYTVHGPFVGGQFTGDLADLPPSQSQVTVGTVTAWVEGGPSDSAPVEMTAAPIPPCDQLPDGSFSFTTSDDYSVCAFKGSGNWATTTTLNRPLRGKSHSPSATVRDGVPGNWCNTDDDLVVDDSGSVVTSYWLFPTPDGTCLNGGAGGEEIPVRNHDTFYLATWRGNVVNACPGVYPDNGCTPPSGG